MKSNKGASAVEYGIVIAAVSLAAISAVSAFGTDIRDSFLTTSDALAGSSSELGQSSPSDPSIFNHFPVDSELTAQPVENCIEDTTADDYYVSRGTGPVSENELSYNCITFSQQGTDYLEWTDGSTYSPLQVAVTSDYSGTLNITSGPGTDYFEIYGRQPGTGYNVVTLDNIIGNDIIYFDTLPEYAAVNSQYMAPTQNNKPIYVMSSGQVMTQEDMGTVLQIFGTPSSIRFQNGLMSMPDFEQLSVDIALEGWEPGSTRPITGGRYGNTFDVRGYTVFGEAIEVSGNGGNNEYVWDGFGDLKVSLLFSDYEPDQPDTFTVPGKTLEDIDSLTIQTTDIGNNKTISNIYLNFDQGHSIIFNYRPNNLGHINLGATEYTVEELFEAYHELGSENSSF